VRGRASVLKKIVSTRLNYKVDANQLPLQTETVPSNGSGGHRSNSCNRISVLSMTELEPHEKPHTVFLDNFLPVYVSMQLRADKTGYLSSF